MTTNPADMDFDPDDTGVPLKDAYETTQNRSSKLREYQAAKQLVALQGMHYTIWTEFLINRDEDMWDAFILLAGTVYANLRQSRHLRKFREENCEHGRAGPHCDCDGCQYLHTAGEWDSISMYGLPEHYRRRMGAIWHVRMQEEHLWRKRI